MVAFTGNQKKLNNSYHPVSKPITETSFKPKSENGIGGDYYNKQKSLYLKYRLKNILKNNSNLKKRHQKPRIFYKKNFKKRIV